ncbi:MAG TPA: malectin domain-containing carbohydrate-binding protein, partial [Anaerolineales bacterium]
GLEKNPVYDPNSTTTQGLYQTATPSGWSPTAPGDVLRSWLPAGLTLAWGVGFSGNVWLSDIDAGSCGAACVNHEFEVTGAATGRNWPTTWAGSWPGDMAYDAGRGAMCQVNVGGNNGIYCWNPATGAVVGSITGAFPWTSISQRGLAYRPGDDSFYIGGWNQGILYHVAGLSHATPGAVLNQCNPPDGNISGLAWNPAFNIVWEATNSPTDTIYELNPDTCTVLNTLPHPNPGFHGAGLEMDDAGNLWTISQSPNTVYLIDSGVPSFEDVPWLSETPTSGTLPPGGSQTILVSVDTTGLLPGVYNASLFINSNSGRDPVLRLPVNLIVPAYQVGVNSGGPAYVDKAGDTWAADQFYAAGGWGYMNKSSRVASTKKAIGGTPDVPLYQNLLQDPSEYRFDGLPAGVYQIELRFAEVQNRLPGTRLFDVIAEGSYLIPALDVAADVGSFYADNYTFFIPITDGQLNLRFVGGRGYAPPIINALRVTNRPDR